MPTIITFLCLHLTFSVYSEDKGFVSGDELILNRSNELILYHYKGDATRAYMARELNYSLTEFIDYGAVDGRDIYKTRRGDSIKLIKGFREGDIFKVELTNVNFSRKEYFVISRDLDKSSISLIEPKT